MRVVPAILRVPFLALLLLATAPAAAAPGEGDPAPAFSLPGSDGRTHGLADHRGERGVVLAWFPKAFTPGCTEELGDLRDAADDLGRFDVAVYMVSLDEPERNREFAESLGAKHVLLSDPGGEVGRAYGVVRIGGLVASRWTFYIDADGIVRAVDKNVDVSSAGADMVRTLDVLGFPRREEAPQP